MGDGGNCLNLNLEGKRIKRMRKLQEMLCYDEEIQGLATATPAPSSQYMTTSSLHLTVPIKPYNNELLGSAISVGVLADPRTRPSLSKALVDTTEIAAV